MTEISQELVERMVAFCRSVSGQPLCAPETSPFEWHREARAIVAFLPAPVDPDLLIAREVVSTVMMRLGASAEQIAAGEIMAGERDDAIIVHAARECLKRGRELASLARSANA